MRALARSLLLILTLSPLAHTAIAAEPVHGEGRLWRIEPAGDVAASHIFATIHSDRDNVLDLPAAVERAFDSAQRYAFELDFGEGMQAQMAQAMRNPSGPTLQQRLGDADWQRLASIARERGIPPQQLNRLAAWGVALTLATPEVQPRATLDRVLYERAARRDLRITGLETVEEQINAFAGLADERQLQMLRQVIELRAAGRIEALFDQLVEAWLAGDLARLVQLSERNPMLGNAAAQQELERRLVTRRNTRMAKRMQSLLDQGGAFIAIGALHLPGEDGVLRLLEQAGYTVARVDP